MNLHFSWCHTTSPNSSYTSNSLTWRSSQPKEGRLPPRTSTDVAGGSWRQTCVSSGYSQFNLTAHFTSRGLSCCFLFPSTTHREMFVSWQICSFKHSSVQTYSCRSDHTTHPQSQNPTLILEDGALCSGELNYLVHPATACSYSDSFPTRTYIIWYFMPSRVLRCYVGVMSSGLNWWSNVEAQDRCPVSLIQTCQLPKRKDFKWYAFYKHLVY